MTDANKEYKPETPMDIADDICIRLGFISPGLCREIVAAILAAEHRGMERYKEAMLFAIKSELLQTRLDQSVSLNGQGLRLN